MTQEHLTEAIAKMELWQILAITRDALRAHFDTSGTDEMNDAYTMPRAQPTAEAKAACVLLLLDN